MLVALLLFTLGWSVVTVPAALALLAVLLADWLGTADPAPLDLAGKNVWITGAGSGIGEALVRPTPLLSSLPTPLSPDQSAASTCTRVCVSHWEDTQRQTPLPRELPHNEHMHACAQAAVMCDRTKANRIMRSVRLA